MAENESDYLDYRRSVLAPLHKIDLSNPRPKSALLNLFKVFSLKSPFNKPNWVRAQLNLLKGVDKMDEDTKVTL